MCGISALFSKEKIKLSNIFQMTQVIRHRGPDDEGYVFFSGDREVPYLQYGGNDTLHKNDSGFLPYFPDKNISELNFEHQAIAALGHRRLSIIDLDVTGHQPMCSTCREYWIVYNGEVYNFKEIKAELESKGYQFFSQTDSEVILASYIEWGVSCLSRFNGMFAFVIYHWPTKKVFVARDRFGVKPLYMWRSSEGIVAFASEIKQFSVLPGWKPKINGQNAYNFLNWSLTDHCEETLFREVCQLRGGHYLFFSLDASDVFPKPMSWYEIPEMKFSGTFKEAANRFHELLADSIRLRLYADVPVGSCLSGGLDSSSIVCIANSLIEKEGLQKTFSACFQEKSVDEKEFMDAVIKHTGVDAYFTFPSSDNLSEQIESLIWHQDEPFMTSSIFAQWEVFKLVKEKKVKVMLDGQGADESLGGYHCYISPRIWDLFKKGQLLQSWKDAKASKQLHGLPSFWKLLLNQSLPNKIKQPLRKLANKTHSHPSWLNLNQLEIQHHDPFNNMEIRKKSSFETLMLSHITSTNLPQLLRFEDRNSMAHSIEARTPFLDYRLVEFLHSLPPEYLLQNGITKLVLREGMRGIIPDKIRNRIDKIGFATPEETWARKEKTKFFIEKIKESIELSEGFIRPNAIDLANKRLNGTVPFDSMVWRIICFGMWLKKFGVAVK